MLKKVGEELRKIAEMGVEDLRKVEFERKFLWYFCYFFYVISTFFYIELQFIKNINLFTKP